MNLESAGLIPNLTQEEKGNNCASPYKFSAHQESGEYDCSPINTRVLSLATI